MGHDLQRYSFIDDLRALPQVGAVYLYGSRARGDHAPRADIDLAVACPGANSVTGSGLAFCE